jgi:uncharacterized membrane protein
MIVALLGAIKVLLASFFGIEIPNDIIEAIANGVGAVVLLIGIVKTHIKKPKQDSINIP